MVKLVTRLCLIVCDADHAVIISKTFTVEKAFSGNLVISGRTLREYFALPSVVYAHRARSSLSGVLKDRPPTNKTLTRLLKVRQVNGVEDRPIV